MTTVGADKATVDQQPRVDKLTVPYRTLPTNGLPRPYLGLIVTGLDGKSEVIFGLLDSGADRTCFPWGYAALLGYSQTTLELQQITQVQGTIDVYSATELAAAVVPEIPDIAVTLNRWG